MSARVSATPSDREGVPRLEKVPVAASRATLSVSQFYRLAKAGHFHIVKIGERSSAVDAAEVDAFIRNRLASVAPADSAAVAKTRRVGAVNTSAQRAGHE